MAVALVIGAATPAAGLPEEPGVRGDTGLLVGVVHDRYSGITLPGAEVAVGEGSLRAVTNLAGYFRIAVPAGAHEITVRLPGYDVLQLDAVDVTAERTRALHLDLRIEGLALEDASAAPHPTMPADVGVTGLAAQDVVERDGVVRRLDASFQFGGRLQADYTAYSETEPFDGAVGTVANGGEIRRMRAKATGHVGRFEYKAALDFAGYEVDPKDVYVGMLGLPVTVRVGYQFEPWSLEQQTSSRYMTFMERSLAIAFSPERNFGTRVIRNYGDRTHWSVGVYREMDGFGARPGNNYNVTARATHAPIMSEDSRRLLHLGASYTHKFVDGNLVFELRPDAHAAPSPVELEVPATAADYAQAEVSANIGSLGLQAEGVHGWVRSAERSNPRVWAAYAQANFFLTGETRPYGGSRFNRLRPARPLFDGGFGALEVKARYALADFSEANPMGQGEMWAFTTGLNWYPTANLRVMAEYTRADLPDRNVAATSLWNFRFMTDF